MRPYDLDVGAAAPSIRWKVHYNMMRDHLALGTTPGVAEGLPAISGFRWREIITKPYAEEWRTRKRFRNTPIKGQNPSPRRAVLSRPFARG